MDYYKSKSTNKIFPQYIISYSTFFSNPKICSILSDSKDQSHFLGALKFLYNKNENQSCFLNLAIFPPHFLNCCIKNRDILVQHE